MNLRHREKDVTQALTFLQWSRLGLGLCVQLELAIQSPQWEGRDTVRHLGMAVPVHNTKT